MDTTRRGLIGASVGTLAVSGLPACDNLVVTEEPDFSAGIVPITPTEDFYEYECCGVPSEVTAASWNCVIRDRGVDVATIDTAWVEAQTPVEFEHTLQCIGSSPRNLSISNALWGGLPLKDILTSLGVTVDPSIVGIRLLGWDSYDAYIPSSDLEDAPVSLVWRINGEPLPPEHGYPARLIVPGRYGVKNLKWPQAIELLDAPFVDYWTTRGWDQDAVYKANGFILAPVYGAAVKSGDLLTFLGTSYAGKDPVVRVEITFDAFKTVVDCELDYSPGPNRWTLWRYDWTVGERGSYTAQIRVTTLGGVVSSEDPLGTEPYAGYDGGAAVTVDVT